MVINFYSQLAIQRQKQNNVILGNKRKSTTSATYERSKTKMAYNKMAAEYWSGARLANADAGFLTHARKS